MGFADKLLGVSLHPGQIRILSEAFPRGVEADDFPYKFIHMTTGNRFGKSAMMAVLHLWFAVYKHRAKAQYGSADWFDSQYTVLNLGPVNENAYVVREKVGMILQDKADEQIFRKPERGHVAPEIQALFKTAKTKQEQDRSGNPFLLTVPDTEYKGYLTEHNSFLEYRTTDDHGKALQGRKKYCITFDEAARHKDPVTLIASDIAPRTIDTRGVIITASTPHLETAGNYEEVWETGNPDSPGRAPFTMSFRGSMRENPYVTEQMIEEALAGQPDYLIPQVVEGHFVQSEEAFFNAQSIQRAAGDLRADRRRTRGHTYVIAFDLAVAKAGDRSICVVWDVTKMPMEVVEFTEFTRGTKQDALIRSMRETLEWYNNERFQCVAILVFDETGMGGLMFRDDLAILRPKPRGFQFAGGKHKKLSILGSLKIMLDKGLLGYPKSCARITYELKRYRRTDEKLETDAVMAMSMAAHYAERLMRGGRNRNLISDSFVY